MNNKLSDMNKFIRVSTEAVREFIDDHFIFQLNGNITDSDIRGTITKCIAKAEKDFKNKKLVICCGPNH